MSYLLGIDVGTTRTAAAISRANGRPGEIEIVNLGDRSSAVPSVLYLGDDGAVVVGEAAERRAMTDPDHVVREFKRRIGDPTPVLVGGRPWAPEELSALLVRWVADRVAQREGGGAARIAVTHPASWGAHKKDLLGAALHHHGLPVTFLAEPQAAAMHYATAERIEPGSTIAVYDFGGGTFDAAILHKDGAGFGLLGRPEGVDRLGGIDIDEIVFEHVREGIPEAFDGLDDTDPAVLSAVAAVRRECTEAKEALSSDTEVSIPVLTPAGQGSVRLHRSEFDAMIRPHVEETVGALRRAVGSAGLTPDQLSAVLLVGGSSRIPLVAQLVSEQLERPVAVDADPKNAIAMGAALSLMPAAATATGAHVPAPRTSASGRHPIGAGVMTPPSPSAFHPGNTGGYQPAPSPVGAPAGPGVSGAYDSATPPTQRISATGSMPPRMHVAPPPPPPRPAFPERPAAGHDQAPDVEYRQAPGRSPAWLVSAGGAVAVLAVLGAVFLWPHTTSTSTPIGIQTPAATTTPEAPPPTTPAVAPPEDHSVRERPTQNNTRPAQQPPVATNPPATTNPPVTSATKPTTPPPTTVPPTTAPPTTSPPTTVPVPPAPAPPA